MRFSDFFLAGVGGLYGRISTFTTLSLVELAYCHHVSDDITVDLQSLLRIELLFLQHGHSEHSVLNL